MLFKIGNPPPWETAGEIMFKPVFRFSWMQENFMWLLTIIIYYYIFVVVIVVVWKRNIFTRERLKGFCVKTVVLFVKNVIDLCIVLISGCSDKKTCGKVGKKHTVYQLPQHCFSTSC